MPRLNPVTGVLLSGNGRLWYGTRVIGQQEVAGQWRVCIDNAPVSDHGCNALAASGGHWLAWLAGYGLFDEEGLVDAQAGLPATQDGRSPSAVDGTIAIVRDRQNGQGLRLIASDGTVSQEVDDALLTDQLCVVDRTRALWWDAGTHGLRTCGGLPIPKILPGPMGWPNVLFINGDWWISYQSTDENGMVLHPFNSFSGYRIAMPPAFYQHAVVLGTFISLCWARTSADGDPQMTNINPSVTPRVDLSPHSPPPPPPPPEPHPMTGITDAQFASLEALRPTYPRTMTPAQIGAMLNEWTWKHRAEGLGMQAKPSGTAAIQPRTGIHVWNGVRFIVDGKHYGQDVLRGASVGEATPVRGAFDVADPATFVAPVEPLDDGPVDPPDDPPDDPPSDHEWVVAQIAAIIVSLEKFEAFGKSVVANLALVEERLTKLEQAKPPVVELPRLRVRGNTSRDGGGVFTKGHTHAIDLEAVPE